MQENINEFDLHGFRNKSGKAFLLSILISLYSLRNGKCIDVVLITGKGIHSNPETGPVLYPMIKDTLIKLGHGNFQQLKDRIIIQSPAHYNRSIVLDAMKKLLSLPTAREIRESLFKNELSVHKKLLSSIKSIERGISNTSVHWEALWNGNIGRVRGNGKEEQRKRKKSLKKANSKKNRQELRERCIRFTSSGRYFVEIIRSLLFILIY